MGEPHDKTVREDSSGEKELHHLLEENFALTAPSIASVSSFKL
jgi:hypothetical protein